MRTTVAPGMTPPCPSFTLPVTVPVVICAEAADANDKNASSRPVPTRSNLRSMFPPIVTVRAETSERCCNRLHRAQGRVGRRISQDKKGGISAVASLLARRDPMNSTKTLLVALFVITVSKAVHVDPNAQQAAAPPAPDYNAFYQIGPDSLSKDGVPKG